MDQKAELGTTGQKGWGSREISMKGIIIFPEYIDIHSLIGSNIVWSGLYFL